MPPEGEKARTGEGAGRGVAGEGGAAYRMHDKWMHGKLIARRGARRSSPAP
ncbi:hypothetical protein [Cohnella fermenti]|uniref:hypothetical protein n=1 Tax=Cohnella fermenti TaxID=2565925 RepID=UPI001454C81E|nr:hypothetical protein [Cohnella fermenti]